LIDYLCSKVNEDEVLEEILKDNKEFFCDSAQSTFSKRIDLIILINLYVFC